MFVRWWRSQRGIAWSCCSCIIDLRQLPAMAWISISQTLNYDLLTPSLQWAWSSHLVTFQRQEGKRKFFWSQWVPVTWRLYSEGEECSDLLPSFRHKGKHAHQRQEASEQEAKVPRHLFSKYKTYVVPRAQLQFFLDANFMAKQRKL